MLLYAAGALLCVMFDGATVTTFLLAAAVGKLGVACWPIRSSTTEASGSGDSYVEALRFGLPAMFGGIVTLAMYRLDVAYVALWSSTADAGLYSVALAVAEILWILPNAAAQLVIPRAARSTPAEDTAAVCRVLSVSMSVMAIGVSVSSPVLIPLAFGSEFRGAWMALPALSVGAIAIGIWKVLAFDLLARGDAKTRLWSGAVGIVAMATLDVALIPRHGIVGASIGSCVASALAMAVTVRVWRKSSGVRLRDLFVLKGNDLSRIRRRSGASAGVDLDPLAVHDSAEIVPVNPDGP